jgi:hypothetical protein
MAQHRQRDLEGPGEKISHEDTSIAVMVDSGARGDIGNVKMAAANLGVVVDATGKEIELPIRSELQKRA